MLEALESCGRPSRQHRRTLLAPIVFDNLALYRRIHGYMRKVETHSLSVRTSKAHLSRLSSIALLCLKHINSRLPVPTETIQTTRTSKSPVNTKTLSKYAISSEYSPVPTNCFAICSSSDISPAPRHLSDCLSMSRRRLASNIPTLQSRLSFTSTSCDIKTNWPTEIPSFQMLFPIDACSTPITPLEQILHTPFHPPALQRPSPTARGNNPGPSVWTSVDHSADLSPLANIFSFKFSLCPDREILARRHSVVSPPEVPPLNPPRRLSYSHSSKRDTSPIVSRQFVTAIPLDGSTPSRNLTLASPVAIRPSSASRAPGSGAGDGHCRQDIRFSTLTSPHVIKV
ncbi:unnamed protein product [Cyclocybe aegerita]|uniref:Uncharacterized protein n=1 Tax=Cyclocybe aegerita TaxID=1973307 RepID=A0A8S0WSS8_CYCAE|nr:unnamed protein product [Cyclocybe aegerita]